MCSCSLPIFSENLGIRAYLGFLVDGCIVTYQ
jgi:hypothetical protein